MGLIWKNKSHLEKWVKLTKTGHTLKIGLHLEKIGHTW